MGSFVGGLRNAAPAVMMAAGCAPFYWADVSPEVRAGGVCLSAVALILADVQNDKKLGYTRAIVSAVQKIPGMEKADEGTIIGMLTLSAAGFLGVPATADMMKHGITVAGACNNFENYVAFPAGAAFAFQSTRRKLEAMLGKEMRFSYKDAQGQMQQTAPIETSRLLQQLSFLAGAGGITGMGAALGSGDILFTGLMFAAANGLNIKRLMKVPVAETTEPKMQALARYIEKGLEPGSEEAATASAHFKALREQWGDVARRHAEGEPLKAEEIKAMGQRFAAALARVVEQQVRRPEAEREMVRR